MWNHVFFKIRPVIASSDAVQFPPTYDSNWVIEREGKKAGKNIMGLMALICSATLFVLLHYNTQGLCYI